MCVWVGGWVLVNSAVSVCVGVCLIDLMNEWMNEKDSNAVRKKTINSLNIDR